MLGGILIVKNFWLNLFLILIISYLTGSFPSAYIAGKIKGIDVRYAGSKNVGGMNTFSSVGKFAGVLVGVADFSKGAAAAFIGTRFSSHEFIPLLAVVFAMIGHNWMAYIGFKGGKGVATFLGGLLFLSPLSFLLLYLVVVPIALILLKDTYFSQTASFLCFSFFLWYWKGSYWWAIFGILATLVYSIKSYNLLLTYFTENRRDMHPVLKKLFKHFFRKEAKK